ncbi:hypothetical protein GPALN_005726 [Globodera pallida]|nr:hypothetical protein GPALN_005726 [Globodera pallida]
MGFKNTNAIEHIGNVLSDMGLDHLTAAFKKAVEEDMVCRRCSNYYQLLGVDKRAKRDEIIYAYRKLMAIYHPDKNPSGNAMSQLLNEAKETLMDPHKKGIYDQQMYNNYAPVNHYQQGEGEPMDFAVVEPVFPKFGEVLKKNKCEGLAETMEN